MNRAPNMGALAKKPIVVPMAPVAKPGGKVLEGNYLGFSPCDYIPGQQNKTCTEIVNQKIAAMKEANTKKRDTQVTVTVSNDGLLFVFGQSEAARFDVPVKDIASMSLCPKGKSGVLKIAAVLCRASTKRAGIRSGPRTQDMICHVWRPKDATSLWDFYATFEAMLKHRGVNDPYLAVALDTSSERRVSLSKDVPVRKSVVDHFEKTGIDRLELLMDQLAATDKKDTVTVKKGTTARVFVKPCKEDADSDIELDLSDDEDDMSSEASGIVDERLNLSKVVTLNEATADDAQC